MAARAPRWTRTVTALAFLGFALFAVWERSSFAPGFLSVVPALGQRGSEVAVWALAGLFAVVGVAALLGYLSDPWVPRLARWVLAVIFFAAAVPKIMDPAGFAMDISNYSMLPKAVVNAMAITLPWIEALVALTLLTGVMRDGSVLLVNLMMALFVVALAQAGLRGLDINCGCFGHGGAAEPIVKSLLRDALFLGWSFPLLFTERR